MAFIKENYKEEYPFKSNYFTHKSGLMQHYVDEGNGQPFLMVHGNPSWSFLYRDMIKSFMGDYRCIAPDHIGCGLSEKPDNTVFPYTLKAHIDNLEALIDSLNLTQPLVIAVHDWGGAIGMGYAVRHPEKVSKLVILNTAAFRLPNGCAFPWPIWAFRHTEIGPELNRKLNAFSFIASLTCSIKGMSKKIRDGFVAPYDSPQNRVATTEFVLDIPLNPGDRSYEELLKTENGLETLKEKPMIICFGRRDFCFNRHFYNEWVKRFPFAEKHTYNAGHYLLEDAGDEIFKTVKCFLER
ncbi:MAG: alpha/beta fold hydrolase [Candidatus Riflebacteria bacterium]|nr:alpha/beta fold hydrolase [Candidatus Riflebacteria bacterium]NLV92997.1 alpha/beta fold hydrolase [Candidatus Riflebacteria bacterium]